MDCPEFFCCLWQTAISFWRIRHRDFTHGLESSHSLEWQVYCWPEGVGPGATFHFRCSLSSDEAYLSSVMQSQWLSDLYSSISPKQIQWLTFTCTHHRGLVGGGLLLHRYRQETEEAESKDNIKGHKRFMMHCSCLLLDRHCCNQCVHSEL